MKTLFTRRRKAPLRKMKFCPGCTTEKPVSEFNPSRRGEERGYSVYCKECAEWYKRKEISLIKTQANQDEFVYAAF